MAKVGYIRLLSQETNINLQINALQEAGCDKIFIEQFSVNQKRTEFEKCIAYLKKDDTLVVWKLDHIGCTTKKLFNLVEEFQERGISLRITTLDANCPTSAEDFFFKTIIALAKMDREIVKEKRKIGLSSARERGKSGGRKPISRNLLDRAMQMYDSNMTVDNITKTLEISRTTFYKYLKTYTFEEKK